MNPPTKSRGFQWPTDDEPIEVVQGDCIKFMQKLDEGCIQALITDPPYGMSFVSGQRVVEKKGFDGIANDSRPFIWFLYEGARVLEEGGVLICFCRWDGADAFRQAIEWSGLRVIDQLIWDRVRHGMGDLKGAPSPQHDMMWLAAKGKYTLPDKRPTTVYRHQRVDGDKMQHPTEKPVPLMEHLIEDYTRPGDLILDCFGGSGATGIAAWNTGRKCVMTELSEQFVAVQRSRLAKLREGLCEAPKGRKQRADRTEDPNPLV